MISCFNHCFSVEKPREGSGMDGPYKSLRYIMIGKNETIVNSESPKMNWIVDNTKGLVCQDLNARVIDASMTLTDFREGWGSKEFVVVEFSGTEYSISTIRVKKDRVYGFGDWRSAGPIGKFFGCNQTRSTTKKSPPRVPTFTKEPVGSAQPTKSAGFPIFWIILLILLILAVIGVITWCALSNGGSTREPTPPPPATAPTPAPASTPGPTVENTDSAISPMNSDTTTVRSKDSLTTGSGAV